jgi:hypothetical protein
MLRQTKVVLGLIAVFNKEFVPHENMRSLELTFQKTSKFGKWKIVRPENSQKLSRTSSGKTTARIVERTARTQSCKKQCRKARG